MNQPPYDFNSESGIDEYLHHRRRRDSDADQLPEPIYVEPEIRERAIATSNTLRRYFLILLSVGLGLGAILAIGLVLVLNYLGLTDKPDIERNPSPLDELPQYESRHPNYR
jgi:hypothetical protein